ncbi:MAG: bacteriocin [Rhodobacteraceae bacterium]|nr:bacteriocin [Paracoccaceae bacterium]
MTPIIVVALSLALSGCFGAQTKRDRMLVGAGIGAATGAAIGTAVGSGLGGTTVAGAVIGGIGGGIIGSMRGATAACVVRDQHGTPHRVACP